MQTRTTYAIARRKTDRSFWIIRLQDGRPDVANGPLTQEQLAATSVFRDFTAATVASGWDPVDFEWLGGELTPIENPLHRFRRDPVVRDDGDSFSVSLNSDVAKRADRPRPIAQQLP